MKKLITLSMLLTVGGAFAQAPNLVPAPDLPETPIAPIAWARADQDGNMIGGWKTIRRNPQIQVPAWGVAADTMNFDVATGAHTTTVWRTPAPPAASLWGIGAPTPTTRFWNAPFVANDQTLTSAANGKAAGMLGIRWLFNPSGLLTPDALVSARCVMLLRFLTASGDNASGVGNSNGEVLGGLFLDFGNTASGAYVLSGLVNTVLGEGVTIPLPWTDGSVANRRYGQFQIAIGTIDGSGNFVQAPGQSALRWGSPAHSEDTVLPGTNPTFTDRNNWQDNTSPANYQVPVASVSATNPGWNTPNFSLESLTALGGGTPTIAGGEYLDWFSATRGFLSPQYFLGHDTNGVYASGTIDLTGLSDPSSRKFKAMPVDIVAVDANNVPIPNGTEVFADQTAIAMSENGEFFIAHPFIDNGDLISPVVFQRYMISMKRSHWLRKNIVVDFTSGSVSGLNFVMVNGDVNNDNEVGAADFSALAAAYDSVEGDANYNANADLNEDGEVGAADFSILAAGYDEVGDDDLTP